MELYRAHNQWANRPDDERFWTLREAADEMRALREKTVVLSANFSKLRVVANHEGDISVVGQRDLPVPLTHFAFGQLAQRLKAPASFLRELPPDLVEKVLNERVRQLKPEDEGISVIVLREDPQVIRAFCSESYTHIWNYELLEVAMQFEEWGWRVPPARPPRGGMTKTRRATEADVLGGGLGTGGAPSVDVGDEICPSGIYASDHDMFVFMVCEKSIDDGAGHGLNRGFFMWNGEVPGVSVGWCEFTYDMVCGNHIVWGARDVREVRYRHVGDKNRDKFFQEVEAHVVDYDDDSTSDIEAKIKSARTVVLGKDRAETVEEISKLGIPELGQKLLSAAYDRADQVGRYGPPNTLWGVVNGLTEVSQEKSYSDDRNSIDRAAGRLLELKNGDNL